MPTTFSKNLTLFFLLFIFSVMLWFFDGYSYFNWLRGGAEKVINPGKTGVNYLFGKPFLLGSSPEDLLILQAKIDYLEGQKALSAADLTLLEQENEALRKQLGIDMAVQGKFVPVKKIAVVGGIMTLAKGEKDGIKKEMIVISEGFLVGKIAGATPFSSRVVLPSAEGSEIKVRIVESGQGGVIRGTPEGRIILDEILQEVELKEGQVVVTSGEEEKYPADIPIGVIEKILKDDVQIYQQAEVKPLKDYNQMQMVMVGM